MNFLAHLALSGEEEEVILGNFMGDAVKGRLTPRYSGHLLNGLRLHRFIDQFTDEHPINASARKILHKVTGKYAGVALDLTYDHFLAKRFQEIKGESLINFEARMIRVLFAHEPQMPDRTQRLFQAMSTGHWLSSYASEAGFERACVGLGSRIPRKNGLEFVPELVKQEHIRLQDYFDDFFPKLEFASAEKLLYWDKIK